MISAYHPVQASVTLSVFVFACGPLSASAEPPGEIPKPLTYEGSMKLQEQPRQPDQPIFQQQPQYPQGGGRAASGSGGAAAAETGFRSWQERPLLPPERNPVLWKWNPHGAAPKGPSGAAGRDFVSG